MAEDALSGSAKKKDSVLCAVLFLQQIFQAKGWRERSFSGRMDMGCREGDFFHGGAPPYFSKAAAWGRCLSKLGLK